MFFYNFIEKYVRLKLKNWKLMLLYLLLLNMSEYAWICQNKQDSEYVSFLGFLKYTDQPTTD